MRKIIAWLALHLVGNRGAKGIKFSHQLRDYKWLKKAQWNSLETNIAYQKKELYQFVCFAIQHVPYYKDMGFSLSDFKEQSIYEDIRKFPILTKDIIRKEKERLLPDIDIGDWTFDNVSGGTTGEPVRFRHSGKFFDFEQASKLLFDEWAGRKIGDSQIRLWGSERDIISGKKDWMNKIYRWARNEEFINTFKMSDDDMKAYIKRINQKHPKMILAYVQSARELGYFAKEHNIKIRPVKGMMTSAGTLSWELQNELRDIYGCPVINRYGSREMGDMACSCERGEGLHINVFSTYLEILDTEGNTCTDGERGRIITTLFKDYAMPIIRYEIGDVGSLGKEKCSCGRGMPILSTVSGRIIDEFISADGSLIFGDFFTHLFYDSYNVKQFKVIQDDYLHILIKLAFYNKTEGEKNTIFFEKQRRDIRKVMGDEMIVDYEILDDIPVASSGKRIYTECLVKKK